MPGRADGSVRGVTYGTTDSDIKAFARQSKTELKRSPQVKIQPIGRSGIRVNTAESETKESTDGLTYRRVNYWTNTFLARVPNSIQRLVTTRIPLSPTFAWSEGRCPRVLRGNARLGSQWVLSGFSVGSQKMNIFQKVDKNNFHKKKSRKNYKKNGDALPHPNCQTYPLAEHARPQQQRGELLKPRKGPGH